MSEIDTAIEALSQNTLLAIDFLNEKLAQLGYKPEDMQKLIIDYIYQTPIDSPLTLHSNIDRMIKENNIVINSYELIQEMNKHILEHKKEAKKIAEKVSKNIENQYRKIREERKKVEKEIEDDCIRASTVLVEDVLYEQTSQHCYVYRDPKGEFALLSSVVDKNEQVYKPQFGEELDKNVVLLAEKPQDYGTVIMLLDEIKVYIHEWLDVSDEFENYCAWYVLLTWVYDKIPTINYLRMMGDTGTGKSRFLDTVGRICYKATLASGGTTVAAVKRITEKWHGTLIVDEGDFKESNEKNELVKFFNLGFEADRVMFSCDKNDPSKIEFFRPFSPKILSTRRQFEDQALEARCLTEVSHQTNRKDILDTISSSFHKKQAELRNKLLKFRFDYYFKIDIDTALKVDMGDIEPRVRQATRGFMTLFFNVPEYVDTFKAYLKQYNQKLIEERSESFDGLIVNAVARLVSQNKENITAADIVAAMKEEGAESDFKVITARTIGKHLKQLGFSSKSIKFEGRTIRKILLGQKFQDLVKRYVVDEDLLGYMVTFVTSVSSFGSLSQKTLDPIFDKEFCCLASHVTDVVDVTENGVKWDEKSIVWQQCVLCGGFPTNLINNQYFCQKHLDFHWKNDKNQKY